MATMRDFLVPYEAETSLAIPEIDYGVMKMEKNFMGIGIVMNSFVNNMNKDVIDYSDGINKINDGIGKMSNGMDKITGKIEKEEQEAQRQQKKAKSIITKTKKSFQNAQKAISAINFSGLKSGFDQMDQYTAANNKLDRLNSNSKEADPNLKGKVYEAANNSNTSYTDMAGAVSNMASLDTFKSNNEAIDFTEIMQKTLKLDGSGQNLSDITKSMSDGSISGDEFSALVNNAPTIGAAMSAATGKSTSELQKLAEQGIITSEILKKAMLSYGDEISSDFNNQPKTFADIWTSVINKVMNALQPLILLFSNIINSAAFQGAINVIIAGLSYVASLASSLITFFMDHGDVIMSILLALGAVLLGVLAVSIASWFMMYWPILLIVGAISLIIFILGKLGVSFQDVFGFVGGLVGTLYAYIANKIIKVWNMIASFGNFLANFLTAPGAAIKIFIIDLVTTIFGYIHTMAKGVQDLLNKIPGVEVDFTSNASNSLKGLADIKEQTIAKTDYKEIFKTKEYMDYSETASKGNMKASKFINNIEDIYQSVKNPSMKKYGDDYSLSLDDNGIGSTSSPLSTEITGSKGAIDVNMAEEDTQYLRDLAEREYINKFNTTSLSPNVSITFGDVHETADAEKVSKRIAQILREQIAVAAEGAY